MWDHGTSAKVGARSIVITVSVCISVRTYISETTSLNFPKFSVHAAYGGSVLL